MKVHERERLVTDAELRIRGHLLDTSKELDLTEGEQLRVCAKVFADYVANIAKYMIREERHGNSETPGGLAP